MTRTKIRDPYVVTCFDQGRKHSVPSSVRHLFVDSILPPQVRLPCTSLPLPGLGDDSPTNVLLDLPPSVGTGTDPSPSLRLNPHNCRVPFYTDLGVPLRLVHSPSLTQVYPLPWVIPSNPPKYVLHRSLRRTRKPVTNLCTSYSCPEGRVPNSDWIPRSDFDDERKPNVSK